MQMIETKYENDILYLYLSRNDKKNALNPEFVKQISNSISSIPETAKALVISSTGDTFCAGADLDWVRQGQHQSREQNFNESLELVKLLASLSDLPIPVITIAKGAAVGAGAGLLLNSDHIIVQKNTVLSFSEVKIGVVPVAIIEKMFDVFPYYKAKELLLTGRRIKGSDLKKIGITDNVYSSDTDAKIMLDEIIDEISTTKPEAVSMTKHLISSSSKPKLAQEFIAEKIADLRNTEEAREGIDKFFS
jgi:methylglutaconyl-CoA hydratase